MRGKENNVLIGAAVLSGFQERIERSCGNKDCEMYSKRCHYDYYDAWTDDEVHSLALR